MPAYELDGNDFFAIHQAAGEAVAAFRNPRLFGFQLGKTFQHWKMLLMMLALNCGIIGAYLVLTGGTPTLGPELDPEPPTRDPFDRLLLAQCAVDNLRLVTVDRALAGHPLAWREG